MARNEFNSEGADNVANLALSVSLIASSAYAWSNACINPRRRNASALRLGIHPDNAGGWVV
jgi:hypothetical protein